MEVLALFIVFLAVILVQHRTHQADYQDLIDLLESSDRRAP